MKTAGGVTLHNLCTSSHDGLYLYQVMWKYLKVRITDLNIRADARVVAIYKGA